MHIVPFRMRPHQRLLCTRTITAPVGILELRTDGWAAGLYSADLVIDGRSVSAMKLAIAR